ncbi:Uncharacterized protein family UPF0564 [Carpediemonas membranifera]|uniref:Uncharacterized protein family UPF0564 n=1 Tax=Carpediemonas membranifera TaxID=201153 RepID=A0A8J6B0Q5_9EUKA|nr:Uncharacterized protein family UPF0564 [Carpediemonas membranifera]|eukprot:KAG9395925.1 Uncharacterized protein family UPF0564 [Carpediemonas membranifera]
MRKNTTGEYRWSDEDYKVARDAYYATRMDIQEKLDSMAQMVGTMGIADYIGKDTLRMTLNAETSSMLEDVPVMPSDSERADNGSRFQARQLPEPTSPVRAYPPNNRYEPEDDASTESSPEHDVVSHEPEQLPVPLPASVSPSKAKRGIVNGTTTFQRAQAGTTLPPRHFTVPRPFSFLERDIAEESSITRQKREEYLKEIQEREDREYRYRFKAQTPDPEMLKPKLEMIHKDQVDRIEKLKKQREDDFDHPFSFFNKDRDYLERKNAREVEGTMRETMGEELPPTPSFKATPIPDEVKGDRISAMEQKEKRKRARRKAQRVQELLEMSHLPPRMEEAEKNKKPKPKPKKPDRFRANPVPNFKKLQNTFEEQLRMRKAGHERTVPMSYSFNTGYTERLEAARAVIRSQVKKDEAMAIERRWPYLSPAGKPDSVYNPIPKAVHEATEAFPYGETVTSTMRKRLVVERDREEAEELERIRRQDEERATRLETMKRLIAPLAKTNTKAMERARQQRNDEFRAQLRQRKRETDAMMAAIKERVAERPFLLQAKYGYGGYSEAPWEAEDSEDEYDL